VRGRTPKPPELRQRRNRSTTHAMLPTPAAAAKNPVPPLPPREKQTEKWHPKVVQWWESVWRSPMATEFLDSDIKGGLFVLAELYQQLWAGNGDEVAKVAAEIRQQEVRFGLSPIDRRRLQWEIEKGEQADERTARRRGLREAQGKDPRDVLKAVK
jgi:hypothetical protein